MQPSNLVLRQSRLSEFAVSETILAQSAARSLGYAPAEPGDPVVEQALLELEADVIDPREVEEYKASVLSAGKDTRVRLSAKREIADNLIPAMQGAWWLALIASFAWGIGVLSSGSLSTRVAALGGLLFASVALAVCGWALRKHSQAMAYELEQLQTGATGMISRWRRAPIEWLRGPIPVDRLLLAESLRRRMPELIIEVETPVREVSGTSSCAHERSFLVVRRESKRPYFVGAWV